MSEPKNSPNDWLTVSEVARMKGVNDSTIRKAIETEQITAFKAHTRLWLIRRRDVEHWQRSPQGRKKGT